ncbi:hypothetical protein [Cloacibacillus sp. An23]|uniref:hypothetical protein n=1 Tax=Cloacibacillus sp. An23 TaxID=1965591 RepID=UPI000B3ADA13|nr:hypothetical protein [Cloacibacillus sp. An23]OUO94729.1 hypothetical protein B5F39_02345 [Cloacibacillus sp. An23]
MADENVNAAVNETPPETQNAEVPQSGGDDDGSLLTEGLEAAGDGSTKESAEGAAEKTAVKDEASAPEVPERYELKMPDGWTLDEEGLAELTPIMHELKASNEQVQAVADLYIRRMSAARERQMAAERETVKSWREELKNDAEIGGAKYEENLASVKKMLIKYGSEDFYNYLDDSGLGNYPPFVKVMVKIARELEDDRFVPGAAASSDEPAAAAAKMIFDKSLKD